MQGACRLWWLKKSGFTYSVLINRTAPWGLPQGKNNGGLSPHPASELSRIMTQGHTLCTHKNINLKEAIFQMEDPHYTVAWNRFFQNAMTGLVSFSMLSSLPKITKCISYSRRGWAGDWISVSIMKKNNSLFYSSFLYKEYVAVYSCSYFFKIGSRALCVYWVCHIIVHCCALYFVVQGDLPLATGDFFSWLSFPWWATRLLIIYCLYKIFPSPLFPVSMVNSFPASFTWDSFYNLLGIK